ncbi:hypothetical protein EGW08_013928 [Elysia chlorotica]|uniref:Uncharacterized protein n=1 Tax=Elysia chlorotica TaxID=188477 RepID=A0A433TA46_ELYCH|nr:hypothetical protein EGW08_013928 [Elysia chlorotica]
MHPRLVTSDDAPQKTLAVMSESFQQLCTDRFPLCLHFHSELSRRIRQDKVKDVVIQHDNARPHTSRQTQCALQQLELPTIPHPTYSPDLAPSDFFLFPLLKKHLKGNHYETDAEVEADVRSWCRSQTPEFFADGMRKLVQRWRLCIERDASDSKSEMRAAVWQLPNSDMEPSSPGGDDSSSAHPHLNLMCYLEALPEDSGGKADVRSVLWHPAGDSQALIGICEDRLICWDLNTASSSAKVGCRIAIRLVTRAG